MMVLTDEQWAVLEPLVETCRPHAKVPPSDLRRTVEAILWRCTNGAKWRSIPVELGPWWKAAQIFIRWARLGVWDRFDRPRLGAGGRRALGRADHLAEFGFAARAKKGRRPPVRRNASASGPPGLEAGTPPPPRGGRPPRGRGPRGGAGGGGGGNKSNGPPPGGGGGGGRGQE